MPKQLNLNNWVKRSYGKRLMFLYHKKEPIQMSVNTLTGVARIYSITLVGGRAVKKYIGKEKVSI